MKFIIYKIFLTLIIFLITAETTNAQINDYKKQWDKVDALNNKGLTKSAIIEVKEILKSASADKNYPQTIKAALYKMNFENTIEEESDEKNLQFIDSLTNKMNNQGKAILLSIKAEMLWEYVQNNRYSLYDRTKTNTENKSDFKTWSIETFHQNISTLYKASLENETILKNTDINEWDAIIEKGKNTRQNRPTLYDFLAFRAFEYFSNDEIYITQPANKFIINDPDLLSPVAAFTKLKINSSDSNSNHLQALILLQKILQFHSNETKKDALIDADLARIKFVSSYGVFKDKEKLLEQAYLSAEKTYGPHPDAAQFAYLRALIYLYRGNEYNPFSKTDVQFEIRKAKMLCDSIIDKYPGSDGAINANNTLLDIKKNAVKIETEKVCVPGKPFKALLKYKNVPKLYCRIVSVKNNELTKIINYSNDYHYNWQEKLTKSATVRNWSIDLPDLKDFQEHAVEIKIDSLPAGSYFLLTSIDPSFITDNNLLTKNLIYVSNISFINNNREELYILNRETGFPLKKANVQTWKSVYNSGKSSYEFIKKEKYTSDENGLVKLKKTENYDSYYLEITNDGDTLFTTDYISFYPSYEYESDSSVNTFLFTDRSIYRPGQQIFFKGIVVKKHKNQNTSKIVEKFETNVILLDANGQKVASLKLATNEFGSYNGSFKLPEGLLNGRFTLKDSLSGSEQYFNVEEYKRPKFYAEIKKPEGTYRLNEVIKVSGLAKAYAGNLISDAKVTYRVVRKVQFPVWWGWGSYYRISYPMSAEEMEITNGETKTNEKGEFTISFNAIPDENIEKKNQPIFYYEVSADVTDLNGETRSASSSVAVAYQAFQISIESPEMMYDNKLSDIKIKTLNYNDIHETTNVRVELKKLEQPNRIFKERYWDMPDLFLMSKSESYESFPDELYADEDLMSKWPASKVVADFNDSTKSDGQINIKPNEIKPGWYKLIVSAKDKYGEDVYAEKYLEIKSRSKITTDKPIEIIADKKTAEPSDQINYNIATHFDKVWIIQNVIRSDKKAITNYPTLGSNAIYNNKLTINDSDRGGINLCYAFIKNNRLYTGSESFMIPWSNKELNIQYETFRDKLSPGSKEKWKIKIKGNKVDKIASEALISMYDASLDQFMPHEWSSFQSLWPTLLELTRWEKYTFGSENSLDYSSIPMKYKNEIEKRYDELLSISQNYENSKKMDYRKTAIPPLSGIADANEIVAKDGESTSMRADKIKADTIINPLVNSDNKSEVKKESNKKSSIRKNFNETAFFLPALNTDAQGNVEFTFTIPEALTEWKMMTLAHTKDLASAYSEKNVITQKELMVQPNAPRFVRGGDIIQLPAKLVNMSNSELTGTVELELFDAATNKAISKGFDNVSAIQPFKLSAGQSQSVFFPLNIPVTYTSVLGYRFKATTKDLKFTDGEEAAIPVLSNRILVTETMPLQLNGTKSSSFQFNNLLNNNSKTLQHQSLTVEYSSNPAWYAVQALPYLMEYPYECAEQTFNRYYSNALAGYITNKNPKIQSVFEKWKTSDTAALLSNLQKNEELKSALLQETPWVLEAKNENEQKKNISLLFDLNRLASEKQKTLNKLIKMQGIGGGFSWFDGGYENIYITQYILTGIGHLKKLNVVDAANSEISEIIEKAIPFLDEALNKEYESLVNYKINLKKNNLSQLAIQHLYMRSFFPEIDMEKKYKKAYDYFTKQARQYWLQNDKYMQAMIALALHRRNDKKTSKAIIQSLKENSIRSATGEMYWKEFANGGYYWYQAPIESQALMIEAFNDIENDVKSVDEMKTWLLKQKQTQNWKTTKATAEACYALLLSGSNWLDETKDVTLTLGKTKIESAENKTEAGTGYFKKSIPGENVSNEMGNINVEISTTTARPGTTWGGVYWQYWEEMDKIKASETGTKLPIELSKKIFIEKPTASGPVLTELKDGDKVKVGDKIKVRVVIIATRDMEYLHMKDLRASCMEPVNVISEYKWQGGLGYYETTKDASTNFFFDYMRKGTYVFEYPLFVNQKGTYSNGITTICNMYAPEFSSHSEGIKVISE